MEDFTKFSVSQKPTKATERQSLTAEQTGFVASRMNNPLLNESKNSNYFALKS